MCTLYLQKLVLSTIKINNETTLRGVVASRGNITGVARVVTSAQDANDQLQPGEILVATMTTVDYLPAMKKASAFITDDGGATCHAAIIARELGKPCIVGTKFATRLLKTGQKIEIISDKAIINLLKD